MVKCVHCGKDIPNIFSSEVVLKKGELWCSVQCLTASHKDKPLSPFQNLMLCLTVVVIILMLMVAKVHSQPPAGGSGLYSQWYKDQKQESGGPCCGGPEEEGGDGRKVEVRSVGDGYEVYVKEMKAWVLYPKVVNPTYYNPTNDNIAWLQLFNDDGHYTIVWYCLRVVQGA